MQTTRVTRSSVLGKRTHQQDTSLSLATKPCELQLPTPDSTPSPKRARTSLSHFDPDSNKENVPPLSVDFVGPDSSPSSARLARSVRQAAIELFTPPRPKSVRRHASTSTIIAASQLPFVTPPTTPKLLLPLYARTKALLRATCNDATATITCRDTERNVIMGFLQSFVNDVPANRCLYISGSPGTGKTALLSSILKTFDPQISNVVFLNCMSLKNVDALWEKLAEDLAVNTATQTKKAKLKKPKGRAAIEAAITNLSKKCILILDELDHITSDSCIVESILSLPECNPTSLCLIGIANTHTLTSGMSSEALPVKDVLTVHFSPYTGNQLQDILRTRLSELYNDNQESNDIGMATFLPPPTLTLLTKKIAATTGDVRSLFEVLRAAINLAVSSSANREDLLDHSPKVTPALILQALKSHTPQKNVSNLQTLSAAPAACNSEIVAKINCLNLQARVALLSILLASKRLEAGLALTSASPSPRKSPSLKRSSASHSAHACIDTMQLHNYYSAALLRCDAACLNIASKSELGDLLVVLEGAGLITTSPSQSPSGTGAKQGRKALGRSFSNGFCKNLATSEIRLAEGVWVNEVLRGLGIANLIDGDILQSEVRGIWERELVRLERELKMTNQSDLSNLD